MTTLTRDEKVQLVLMLREKARRESSRRVWIYELGLRSTLPKTPKNLPSDAPTFFYLPSNGRDIAAE